MSERSARLNSARNICSPNCRLVLMMKRSCASPFELVIIRRSARGTSQLTGSLRPSPNSIRKRTHRWPSRSKRSILVACKEDVRAPVSILAGMRAGTRSGRPTSSLHPTSACGVFAEPTQRAPRMAIPSPPWPVGKRRSTSPVSKSTSAIVSLAVSAT